MQTAQAPKLGAVPDPGTDGKDGTGPGTAGRLLDIAAVGAGAVLAVILIDLVSGGKITAFLKRRRGGCQDCGEQAPPPAGPPAQPGGSDAVTGVPGDS